MPTHSKTLVLMMLTVTACGAVRARLPLGGAAPSSAAAAAAEPGAPRAQPVAIDPDAPPTQHQRDREAAYKAALAPHHATINHLSIVDAGRWADNRADYALAAFAGVDALADYAKTCATDYAGLTFPRVENEAYQPAVSCALAGRRDALARTAYLATAAAIVAEETTSLRAAIDAVAKGQPVSDGTLDELVALAADRAPAITKLRAQVAPLYAKLGTDVPADAFASIAALGPTVAPAIEASVQQVAIDPPQGKDATVVAETRALFAAARHHDAPPRVRAIHVASRDWSQYNQSSGVPSFRTKMVQGLVQAKGEAFCRLYAIEARQHYGGGGRWNPGVAVVVVRDPQIARCK